MTQPRFFIVNHFDRPGPRLIAEKREDGKLYYVHPELRHKKQHWGMTSHDATPVEDFGITLVIDGHLLRGAQNRDSVATYPDGGKRQWEGAGVFEFSWKEKEA